MKRPTKGENWKYMLGWVRVKYADLRDKHGCNPPPCWDCWAWVWDAYRKAHY